MNKLFAPFLPPWAETGLQPAFYDLESGTVLQQTARMYDKVNQLIRLFNELSEETQTTVNEYITKFTELKDFVDNYFDNLDVQEEINNKLDAMAEDGSLEALMEIWLSKDGFVNGGKHTPEYMFTRYIQSGTSTSFDATVPREMEGICKTGTNKIVVFYRPATVTDSSDALVEEIDYTDNKNPLLLRHNTISNIRSVNSACFDPNTNLIYTWVKEGTFAVIDYTTLTLKRTIVIPDISLASFIAYDNDDNKFYITEGRNVWELNITTLATTKLFEFPDNSIKNSMQGFEVKNRKFYFAIDNPRSIVVTDFEGNIRNIMNIGLYDNVGHASGYIADITFIDDNNILLTPHSEGDYVEMTRLKSSYYINYVAKVNINGNNFESTPINGIYATKEYYVDTSLITDGLSYADGSTTHKFPLISEYLNNKYTVENGFRCTATGTVTYYGTLLLTNQHLETDSAIECEGGSIRSSELISGGSITTKSAPLYSRGSTIRATSLVLGYNNNSNKNYFTTTSLIVGKITDDNDSESGAIYVVSNSFILGLNCKVLFNTSDIAGESNVTVGDIRGYKKIRVIVTDTTSQQFAEEGIVPASGDVYLNFNRITSADNTYATIRTSRMSIARTTGVITIDRERNVGLTTTPTISITEESPQRLKILRVEGYY